MPAFSAQVASSPEIGTWVLIALLIVNGLGGMGGLIAIFATRREVDAMDRRLVITENSIKDETSAVHEKINNVAREVSSLTGKTELQNQQLARIETSILRLTERK